MKKGFDFKRFAVVTLGVMLLTLFACSYIFPELGIVELFGGVGTSGMVLANTAVAGTPTFQNTEDNAPGHKERDISTVVTEIRPDEYPLDTMLRKVRKAEKAGNVKVEFETVKYRERGDATTAAFVADTTTPTNNASVALTVGKIGIWGVDDTVYIKTVAGAGGKALRLHVTSVDRANNKIQVSALNSPTADTTHVPDIPSGTAIYRMGNAKEELASTTDIITQLPTPDYNYCQIQMAYLEQSVLEGLIKSYSGYGHKDKALQEIYNMRSSCEATALFGIRNKFIDPEDNEVKYHADGLEARIATTKEFGTGAGAVDPSLADVLDLLEQTFSGNAGSTDRVLLGGKKVITGLENISFQKEQMATETAMFHGVKVSRLESNFGTLNIKHSKMLDQMGWQDQAFVIDLSHIYKHDLETMHSTKIDPDKAGTRRVKNAVRILENSCISVRYESDVHLVWKPAA